MPNPKGINQYSKGKSAGTFYHGPKSANSSNAGVKGGHNNSMAAAKASAKIAKANKQNKKKK